MAYHLYFLKNNPNLTLKNVNKFLETPIDSSNISYISSDEISGISSKICNLNIHISKTENKIIGDTFDISFYHEMIAISFPYWSDKIDFQANSTLEGVFEILFSSNFMLYDPQKNKIFNTLIETFSTENNNNIFSKMIKLFGR